MRDLKEVISFEINVECNESHGALSTLLLKSPSCSLFSSFEARFIHTRASGLILQVATSNSSSGLPTLRFEVWQVKPLPTALDTYLLQYRRLSAPMLLIPMLQILTLRPPCIPSSRPMSLFDPSYYLQGGLCLLTELRLGFPSYTSLYEVCLRTGCTALLPRVLMGGSSTPWKL